MTLENLKKQLERIEALPDNLKNINKQRFILKAKKAIARAESAKG